MVLEDMGLGSLEFDVAISDVCLAAAKAKAGVHASESEVKAISYLRDVFQTMEQYSSQDKSIPACVNIDEDMRNLLERSLAEISIVSDPQPVSGPVLKKLIFSLEALSGSSELGMDDADELISNLQKINDYSEDEVTFIGQ